MNKLVFNSPAEARTYIVKKYAEYKGISEEELCAVSILTDLIYSVVISEDGTQEDKIFLNNLNKQLKDAEYN